MPFATCPGKWFSVRGFRRSADGLSCGGNALLDILLSSSSARPGCCFLVCSNAARDSASCSAGNTCPQVGQCSSVKLPLCQSHASGHGSHRAASRRSKRGHRAPSAMKKGASAVGSRFRGDRAAVSAGVLSSTGTRWFAR